MFISYFATNTICFQVVIKLSQNTQFYPESNKFAPSERIVLVTGPPEQLCKVAEFIHVSIVHTSNSIDA